ncbi:hypothetical protein YC2023_081511 [Brassica napus]
MVHGVLSNMDLIGQFGVMQSDVHSHMMVELSANHPSDDTCLQKEVVMFHK